MKRASFHFSVCLRTAWIRPAAAATTINATHRDAYSANIGRLNGEPAVPPDNV